MDPQLKSVLTSILMTLSGAATTWGVGVGLVPAEDKTAAANILMTMVLAGLTTLIGWYKARQGSPAGLVEAVRVIAPAEITKAIAKTDQEVLIRAVNEAPNGVKVVAASSPSPTVDKPQRGT